VGIGAYSLNIEIFVYVLTLDGDEFNQIQQDLFLSVLDAVEAAGTELAVPTQETINYPAQPVTLGTPATPPESDRARLPAASARREDLSR
jgi:hypothetical protein